MTNRLLAIGEVLWDIFDQSTGLGGAPLNFSAHAKRLGFEPLLISAVGNDELGDRTRAKMADLGLNTSFIQRTSRFETGTARVELGPGGRTHFVICRPAAYDAVAVSGEQVRQIQDWEPGWFYFCQGRREQPSNRSCPKPEWVA
jgi:fructokinase